MTTLQSTVAKQDPKVGQLKAILFLLQTNLEEFKGDVDRSYSLLQIGEKTPLLKSIENTLDNPMRAIFEMSSSIDDKVKSIIDRFVRFFLIEKRSLIRAAYNSKNSSNNLHYSIVLKDDVIENRNLILDFFDNFHEMEISERYPVYFQFIPIELVKKISLGEEIQLSAE